MKLQPLILALLIGTAAAQQAANPGIDTLQHALEAEYHLHAEHIPMMGMMNVFAGGITKGGVRGMRVVTYESLPQSLDRVAISRLVQTHLGGSWSLMVRDRGKGHDAEDDMVWVQPAGERIRMLVVSLEPGELDLVQMELSPDQLAKWKDEHGG